MSHGSLLSVWLPAFFLPKYHPSKWAVRFAFLVLVIAGAPVGAQTLISYFDVSAVTSPRTGWVPISILITARSANGSIVRNFSGPVTLTAENESESFPVKTQTPLTFVSGQWSGLVTVTVWDRTLKLVIRDTAGHSGENATFAVEAPPFTIHELAVVSLVADPVRQVLYGSLGANSPSPGALVVIDPVSGTVIDTAAVAGGAGRLAIADDASVLYVATDDGAQVRRLRLPGFQEELMIDLGASEPGMLNYVDDLAVAPGKPERLAVTKQRRGISPRFTGLSVYDDALEMVATPLWQADANVVAFGATADRLYGYHNESTRFSLYRLGIVEGGLISQAQAPGLFNGFGTHIQFAAGRLFVGNGRVVNPETFQLLGELPGGAPDALVLPLPSAGRIAYLSPGFVGSLRFHDFSTLRFVGSLPFPVPTGAESGLISWGKRGLAFHNGRNLFLLESPYLPFAPTTDLEMTTASPVSGPVAVGTETELAVRLRNRGAAPARNVLVTVIGSADAVLTAASVPGGTAVVTDRRARLELASLPVNSEVTIQLRARAVTPSRAVFPVSVTSDAIDLNGTNDVALVTLNAAPGPAASNHVIINLATGDLVSVPGSRLLYASLPALSPQANSIVALDPDSGGVSPPVLVGSQPSQLAVSDDGRHLYVGFDGLAEVRRFSLPELQLEAVLPLGASGFGGVQFATDLAVRPGHPLDVAVLRRTFITQSSAQGLVLFRDGQAVDADPDGSIGNAVTFVDSAAMVMYGDTFGFRRLLVTDDGFEQVGFTSERTESASRGFRLAGGRVYFASGGIYEAGSGTAAGRFDGLSLSSAPPWVEPASRRAVFVERGFTNSTLAAYDTETRMRVGAQLLAGVRGTATSLCRWGSDGLAFRTDSQVVLLRSPLAGLAAPAPRLEVMGMDTGMLRLRLTAPGPAQYHLERARSPSGSWNREGAVISGSDDERFVSVAVGSENTFLRLVQEP